MKNINVNTISIIAGDFSIDLINSENKQFEHYINSILQTSFIPCVTIPTRITYHSTSLIDHILLKTTKKLIQTKISAGNIINDISDHLPNFIIIAIFIQKNSRLTLNKIIYP